MVNIQKGLIMSSNLYFKPNGQDGYCLKNVNNVENIDNSIECCKNCGNCGRLSSVRVCTSNDAIDLIFNNVNVVMPNGYCDKFDAKEKKYSKFKMFLLTIRGIQQGYDK